MRNILSILLVFLCSSCADLNEYEKDLIEKNQWPVKVVGYIDIIDAAAEDENTYNWAIGIVQPMGSLDKILVEFQQDLLTEVDIDNDLPDPVVLWVNPPIEEYFQVISVGDK